MVASVFSWRRTRCDTLSSAETPPPSLQGFASRSIGSQVYRATVFRSKTDCTAPPKRGSREQLYLEVETHRVSAVRQFWALAPEQDGPSSLRGFFVQCPPCSKQDGLHFGPCFQSFRAARRYVSRMRRLSIVGCTSTPGTRIRTGLCSSPSSMSTRNSCPTSIQDILRTTVMCGHRRPRKRSSTPATGPRRPCTRDNAFQGSN